MLYTLWCVCGIGMLACAALLCRAQCARRPQARVTPETRRAWGHYTQCDVEFCSCRVGAESAESSGIRNPGGAAPAPGRSKKMVNAKSKSLAVGYAVHLNWGGGVNS